MAREVEPPRQSMRQPPRVARCVLSSTEAGRPGAPDRPGTLGSELSGVSCVSDSSCSAVGSEGNAALTESWNGKVWRVVPNPSLLPRQSALQGVSCASADSSAAVGVSGDATLVKSWNGTSWSVEPTPTPGTYGGLSGVSCSRGGKCTGVGFDSTGTGSGVSTLPRTLVEAWNGSRWSVVQSPSPPVAYLNGISCVARKSCMAVGDYPSNSGVARTLVESWNGERWSIVPSPSPPAGDLYGVSCASSRSCEAVGQYATNTSGTAPSRALIMSWNGRTWSSRPSSKRRREVRAADPARRFRGTAARSGSGRSSFVLRGEFLRSFT